MSKEIRMTKTQFNRDPQATAENRVQRFFSAVAAGERARPARRPHHIIRTFVLASGTNVI
jgi:hypothetical protein